MPAPTCSPAGLDSILPQNSSDNSISSSEQLADVGLEDCAASSGNFAEVDVSIENGLIDPSHQINEVAISVLEAPVKEAVRFFVEAEGARVRRSDVGFICQANTTFLECRAQATQIFSFSQSPIDTIYNPALTGWSSCNVLENDPRVLLLQKSWDDFFDSNSDNALCRLQLCAGDSTFLVKKALEGYRYALRIIVIAISPSCSIPSNSCLRVRLYRAFYDVFSMHRNSLDPEILPVPRHPEHRHLCDQVTDSSTYLELLRMEVACFHLRQNWIEEEGVVPETFDVSWQQLSRRYLEIYETEEGSTHYIPRTEREKRKRQLLKNFFDTFRGPDRVLCLSNPCESFSDEYPTDLMERNMTISNLSREASLMIAILVNLFLYAFRTNPGVMAPLIVGGTQLVDLTGYMLRLGVYVSRRNQDGGTLWRECRLPGQVLDIVGWLCNLCMLSALSTRPDMPPRIFQGLGTYLGVRGANILINSIIISCPSLRGRLQRFLVCIEEGDIQTPQSVNLEAVQVGVVRRILRSSLQIGMGLGSLAVAGLLAAPVFFSSGYEESINDTSRYNGTSSITGDIIEDSLYGITGLLAVASIATNIMQIRRLVRVWRIQPEQMTETRGSFHDLLREDHRETALDQGSLDSLGIEALADDDSLFCATLFY